MLAHMQLYEGDSIKKANQDQGSLEVVLCQHQHCYKMNLYGQTQSYQIL